MTHSTRQCRAVTFDYWHSPFPLLLMCGNKGGFSSSAITKNQEYPMKNTENVLLSAPRYTMYYISLGIFHRQGTFPKSGTQIKNEESAKYNETIKFGNKFSGSLGDSEFVPRACLNLGGYSFWGYNCCLGIYCDVPDQRLVFGLALQH